MGEPMDRARGKVTQEMKCGKGIPKFSCTFIFDYDPYGEVTSFKATKCNHRKKIEKCQAIVETWKLNALPQPPIQLQQPWLPQRQQQPPPDLTAMPGIMSLLLEMAVLVSLTSSSGSVANRLRGQRIQEENQGSLGSLGSRLRGLREKTG